MNRIPSYQEYVDFVNRQQMGSMPTGYGMPQPQQMGMQPNVLPAKQVLQANGRASINALRMSPNSSVLIMDTTAPLVWLCTSDSLGNVTPVAYDISPHKDTPTPDVSNFEQRLSAVEAGLNGVINKWEEMTNVKSNAGSSKPKQAVRSNGESGSN